MSLTHREQLFLEACRATTFAAFLRAQHLDATSTEKLAADLWRRLDHARDFQEALAGSARQ
jgi:hypothetical protein